VRPGVAVQVLDYKTNIPVDSRIKIDVQGRFKSIEYPEALLTFTPETEQPISLIVSRGGITLGEILLTGG